MQLDFDGFCIGSDVHHRFPLRNACVKGSIETCVLPQVQSIVDAVLLVRNSVVKQLDPVELLRSNCSWQWVLSRSAALETAGCFVPHCDGIAGATQNLLVACQRSAAPAQKQ
jgi:hypothetical protein